MYHCMSAKVTRLPIIYIARHWNTSTCRVLKRIRIICQRFDCCRVYDVEKGYYADGEDAYDMRKPFTDKCNEAFSSQVRKVKQSLQC